MTTSAQRLNLFYHPFVILYVNQMVVQMLKRRIYIMMDHDACTVAVIEAPNVLNNRTAPAGGNLHCNTDPVWSMGSLKMFCSDEHDLSRLELFMMHLLTIGNDGPDCIFPVTRCCAGSCCSAKGRLHQSPTDLVWQKLLCMATMRIQPALFQPRLHTGLWHHWKQGAYFTFWKFVY
jgi:hypothetical protein